jgi:hypothetical protein
MIGNGAGPGRAPDLRQLGLGTTEPQGGKGAATTAPAIVTQPSPVTQARPGNGAPAECRAPRRAGLGRGRGDDPPSRQKQGAGPAGIQGTREDTASRSPRPLTPPNASARVPVRSAPAPDEVQSPDLRGPCARSRREASVTARKASCQRGSKLAAILNFWRLLGAPVLGSWLARAYGTEGQRFESSLARSHSWLAGAVFGRLPNARGGNRAGNGVTVTGLPLQRTRFAGVYRRASRFVVVYRSGGRQRKQAAATLAEWWAIALVTSPVMPASITAAP